MASEPEAEDPQFVDAAMDLDETAEELETDNDVFDNAVTKEAVLQVSMISWIPNSSLGLGRETQSNVTERRDQLPL